jgi:23S rRNA (guanosine2251-2'-O)-methyltransferase
MKSLVIYGINPVVEALRSNARLENVQIMGGLNVKTRREIEDLAHERSVLVIKTDKRQLDRLSDGGVHQGVVALWGTPAPVALDDLARAKSPGRKLLICLDEIQDPRNFGALARSALAFGAAGLVLQERRSVKLTSTAVKASAGALCRMKVARVTNLGRALQQLKKLGFWIAGAVVDGGQAPWEINPGDKMALVLGSEGAGLRPAIAAKLDYLVKIPMIGAAESLNVSVAGALLMYEWLLRTKK